MALNSYVADFAGSGPTMAQPTTTEVVTNPGPGVGLLVTVGSTATTVTLVRPGNDEVGLARPDKVSASLQNVTKLFKIDRAFYDSAVKGATVLFSQVTGVTASVVRL